MLHAAGAEPLPLDWLLGRMGERSFGLVLLLLSVFGLLPGVSAFVAVLLMVPAIQMLLARSGPVFPRGIRRRRFEARRLAALLRYVIPALRWLERFVRPRWTTPAEGTKRVVGGIVFVLSAGLLAPVPLSNVPPALAIIPLACVSQKEPETTPPEVPPPAAALKPLSPPILVLLPETGPAEKLSIMLRPL